ncbi:hypothetical protein GCM10023196_017820 [Actinoallomurus vinaceus]|uniref:Intradiol ring-cleavage dioxygenases domain-containing protein n=1 Tax=Actinoallomurus vinaceus TaxID=1080074 RepID=A0ABP8U3H5_9ACTN
MNEELHDHDRGLSFDLVTLNRRRALLLMGGAGIAAVASALPGKADADAAACTEIPSETAGPYPADGSNGPNVLTQSGIVRSDIRSSFGGMSGTATGVPLTIKLTIETSSCAPFPGAAVYLWHCNATGGYSLYSAGLTNVNYLRGVQVADSSGLVTFTSIFPGCYSGRWPHIHFEVYRTLAEATAAGDPLKTSQLALPAAACQSVYATSGYGSSASNLSRVSLDTDMVFRDGYATQLATVTGNTTAGYTATLTVPA